MISHVSVVGLIDIEHMQSVIKVFFILSKIAAIFIIGQLSEGYVTDVYRLKKKSADLR